MARIPAPTPTRGAAVVGGQRHSDETLVLENGSGLSRRERVSARLMGQVLLNAARGPYASEFLASSPIAGEDGTLKNASPIKARGCG